MKFHSTKEESSCGIIWSWWNNWKVSKRHSVHGDVQYGARFPYIPIQSSNILESCSYSRDNTKHNYKCENDSARTCVLQRIQNVITRNVVFNWRWRFVFGNSWQKHDPRPRVRLLTPPPSKFCLSSTAGIRRNEPRWCNYEKYVCERINLVSLCTWC